MLRIRGKHFGQPMSVRWLVQIYENRSQKIFLFVIWVLIMLLVPSTNNQNNNNNKHIRFQHWNDIRIFWLILKVFFFSSDYFFHRRVEMGFWCEKEKRICLTRRKRIVWLNLMWIIVVLVERHFETFRAELNDRYVYNTI